MFLFFLLPSEWFWVIAYGMSWKETKNNTKIESEIKQVMIQFYFSIPVIGRSILFQKICARIFSTLMDYV